MEFTPAFDTLDRDRLETMAAAADCIRETYRRLQKANANIVGRVLAHQGTFFELDHYPAGDVYDDESHSQYYYHAHRGETGEHGHFHTFLRAAGIPPGIEPVPYDGAGERPTGEDALSHLVAISMDAPGFPVAMFTTNRWVTGETFYAAADVVAMLDRFDIDHVHPCLAVNTWIGAMLRLFRPQVEALLHERDRRIADQAARYPDRDVFEDRTVEITSILPVDVSLQSEAVLRALTRHRA